MSQACRELPAQSAPMSHRCPVCSHAPLWKAWVADRLGRWVSAEAVGWQCPFCPCAHQADLGLDHCASKTAQPSLQSWSGSHSHPPSPAVPPSAGAAVASRPPPAALAPPVRSYGLFFCLKIKLAAGSYGSRGFWPRPPVLPVAMQGVLRGQPPHAPWPPMCPHTLLRAVPPPDYRGPHEIIINNNRNNNGASIPHPMRAGLVPTLACAVAAALGSHGSCPAAHAKGFPQGFSPHAPT